MTQTRAACLRLMRIRGSWPAATRAERADRATAMCDARAAIALAKGVDPADIDPATGHNVSWEAYQRSRRSWVNFLAEEQVSEYAVRDCARAKESWARRRPKFLERVSWPDPESFRRADRRLAEETRSITDDWREWV